MLGEAPKRKDSAAERMLDAFASKYVFFAVFLFFNKGMCEKWSWHWSPERKSPSSPSSSIATTVDGGNPAPVTPLFTRFYTSKRWVSRRISTATTTTRLIGLTVLILLHRTSQAIFPTHHGSLQIPQYGELHLFQALRFGRKMGPWKNPVISKVQSITPFFWGYNFRGPKMSKKKKNVPPQKKKTVFCLEDHLS